VVPDRAAAEFWLRYPDPVYLDEALALVQDAARAAALATGTKVRIDVDTASRDGISVGALNELAWAHLKALGAGKLQPEAGRPVSFEETGSVSTQFPGIGVSAYSSNFANHTFGMEADALTDVGHNGFIVDAQTMAAVLYAFATDAPYRATVRREFKGLQALYAEYLAALKTAYPVPTVAEPGAP
jgi:metal-dependent amidase/aminoacylase/carboxypeptidase family protein